MGEPSLVDWLTSPGALVTAAVFGAVWGSFLNVCIARIPRGESVVRPPSHCFACGRTIRARDNIPVLSYLLLRGRCRACGARYSPRYLLVELLVAALSTLVWWRLVMEAAPEVPAGARVARYALGFAFCAVLVVLSFIDLDTKRLPDVITLPAIPIFFLAGFGAELEAWLPRLIGVVAGYGLVRIIADGYYYLTGREGLGLGDGKLLAVIGAVLGWKAILAVIFMASFVGIAVSVPLLLAARRREPAPPAAPRQEGQEGQDGQEGHDENDQALPVRHTQVPFGPFLSLSAVVYLLCGDILWSWFVGRISG